MPLDYLIGDATRPFGLGPKVICHCVNDIGQWGSGFVLALTARWSEPEERYREWHRTGSSALEVTLAGEAGSSLISYFHLGGVQFVQVQPRLWVANIIGQHRTIRDEAAPIRYEALALGFKTVATFCQDHEASVHAPRLGAGLARGRWPKIADLLERELVDSGIPVTVYDLA